MEEDNYSSIIHNNIIIRIIILKKGRKMNKYLIGTILAISMTSVYAGNPGYQAAVAKEHRIAMQKSKELITGKASIVTEIAGNQVILFNYENGVLFRCTSSNMTSPYKYSYFKLNDNVYQATKNYSEILYEYMAMHMVQQKNFFAEKCVVLKEDSREQ